MNRKQRRLRDRQLKKSGATRISAVESAVSRMPEKCDECGVHFDRSNKTQLDKWRIAVYDDGPINLVCPACVPDDIKNNRSTQ